jgi:hypothetical protein
MTDTYPENLTEILDTAFHEYWDSPNELYLGKVTSEQMVVLTDRWNEVIRRRFVDGEVDNFHVLRMSAIGKPLIELLYNKFHEEVYHAARLETSVHSHQRMSEGDEFEIDLAIHLVRMGFIFEDFQAGQRELTYRGVTGHTDYIVSHPELTNGLPILFECKAIHSYNWKTASKYVDDKYGYYTQLGLYSRLTGLPGYWVLYNKDTSEITIKAYESQGDEETKDLAIKRLDLLIDLWEMEDLTWEDCFQYVRPPDPVPEVFQGAFTGRFLVPPSMKFCNCTPEVYELEEAKNGYKKPQTYVNDYRYPEQYQEYKPDIMELIGGGESDEDDED